MDTMQEAMALERVMLPIKRWHEAPKEVQKQAQEAVDEGIPTGIAHSEKRGWCIIQSGQGPYIAWSER